MKRFSSEFIEQVRQANDIVSVISDYVTLKRRGRNFWACCPFHNEKTASFSVAADKGFFYCFGCHAHGDVFQFIMKKENLSFSDAVERLAERAHIALPVVERSAEEIARDKQRDRLYQINEMAGNFFHNCLTQTHYGQPGLAYFHKRHVSDDTIEAFKLGFAPESWDKLTTAFMKKGVTGRELVLLGLAKEKNGHFYDAFRGRVMFPIRDGRSRIVGFGGRVLDDSKPKYLNSPETPIFNKRRLLFAMDLAHKAIYEQGKAILVEGYMDVVSAHNRGIHNVVASLGTSFTPEQARLLQRQAKELVLGYDMDGAGRQATQRAMEIVRGLGMRIRVLSLPQGKDPDEYINAAGPDKFRQAVDEALAATELTELAEAYPPNLNRGEKQRVAIASAIAMHTKYIVLDEPTSGQDSEDKDQLMALLTDLNKKGMTILIISHDMDIFAEYCQRVLVIGNHTKAFDGTPQELFTQRDDLYDLGLSRPDAVTLSMAVPDFPYCKSMKEFTTAMLERIGGMKK